MYGTLVYHVENMWVLMEDTGAPNGIHARGTTYGLHVYIAMHPYARQTWVTGVAMHTYVRQTWVARVAMHPYM